jgi:HSP20 family protein
MERDIDSLFGQVRFPNSRANTQKLLPAIDVYEKDNTVHVQAELAGVPKENVQLEINDNVLTVSGERKRSGEFTQDHVHYHERVFGTFQRQVTLPEGTSGKGATASYENGVLHVKLQKIVPNPPQKITIE